MKNNMTKPKTMMHAQRLIIVVQWIREGCSEDSFVCINLAPLDLR